MYSLQFINFDDPQGDNVLHGVEWFDRNSFSLDPRAISGVDFHSLESRLLRFETEADSWITSNLLGAVGTNVIGKIQYYRIAVKVFDNGVEEGVFYIRKDGVVPTVSSNIVSITARDILGLLIDYNGEASLNSNEDYTHYGLLEDMIRESLRVMANGTNPNSTPFNISINRLYNPVSSGIGYPVNGESILSTGYNSWNIGNPPTVIYEEEPALIYSHKFVLVDGVPPTGSIIAGAVKYWRGIYKPSGGTTWRRWEKIDLIYTNITNSIDVEIISEMHETRTVTTTSLSEAQISVLYNENWLDLGYPTTSTSTVDFGDDTYYYESDPLFGTDDILRMTGTQELVTVRIIANDENGETGYYNYWSLISGLLFMNNLALYTGKDGSVNIIQKTTAVEGLVTVIPREIQHDVTIPKILVPSVDYKSKLSFLQNSEIWTPSIQAYYETLLSEIEDEYNGEIETSAFLEFLTPFNAIDKNFVVISIGKDANGDFYQIKGWNKI